MYHPRYKKHDHYNDVAVIVLDDNFELDRHINTICLPKELDTAKYISWDKCFATGWGKDSFGNSGRYQEILKQVKLNMVDHDNCQARLKKTKLGNLFSLDDSFICAGGEAEIDLCTGDGGGPLVCPHKKNPNTYYQVGFYTNIYI